jgi:hypothetical protein
MTTLKIGGTGASKPYVKYNAKADKWFVRGPDGKDAEISRPTFVVDFDNVATGWLRFREGMAPERVMDPNLDSAAPQPSAEFKRGFVVSAYSTKYLGGIAEFASASLHVANAIKDLYAQYETEKAQHPGELPVISCTGSEAKKDRFGTNYRPILQIVSWVARPADLPNRSPIDPSEMRQASAATTAVPAPKAQAQHVPPPAAKPVAEPLGETLF